ncbi:MAG TPA: TfoX/Sxy family protein [Streptosporangiaceae bacterium]|jgi:TfoX/Sxy family transcriptional regulator of competence genes
MEIPKPTDADREYFRSLLPDNPWIEVKPMFGNLGAFVKGNMFAGLFGASVGVRLADADRDELAAVDGAGPFGPAERPMGGYLSLPPAWRADPERAADWMGRAFTYVGAMPPKKAKPSRAKPRGR